MTATYASITTSWTALKSKVRSCLSQENQASEAFIKQRQDAAAADVRRAQGQADRAKSSHREHQNALTMQILRESNDILAEQKGAQTRLGSSVASMRSNYAGLNQDIEAEISKIEGLITGRYATGQDTPTTFDEHAGRWAAITAKVVGLHDEITRKGLEPSWQAFSSSAAYREAVHPQLEGLKELKIMTETSDNAAQNVALVQVSIYEAMNSSIGVASAGVPAPITTDPANMYGSSRTALNALKELSKFADRNAWASGADWNGASNQVAQDLVAKRTSMQVLGQAGNWPEAAKASDKMAASGGGGGAPTEVSVDITEAESGTTQRGWSL